MHWIRRHRRGRPPHPDVLTPAEWRVLELVREGHPNAEIAARLGITMATVKTHVTRILAKTDTRDRRELAQWEGEPAVPASTPERGRGFALPLAGWFSGGAAKAAGGGVAAVMFLGAVFAAFTMLVDAGEENGAPMAAVSPSPTEEASEEAEPDAPYRTIFPAGEEIDVSPAVLFIDPDTSETEAWVFPLATSHEFGVSPDGSYVVWRDDGGLRLLDTNDGSDRAAAGDFDGLPIAYGPDGTGFIAYREDLGAATSLYLDGIPGPAVEWRVPEPHSIVADWSADGAAIAIAQNVSGTLRMTVDIDGRDGSLEFEFDVPDGSHVALRWSRNGQRLALITGDQVRVFDRDGDMLWMFEGDFHGNPRWSPDDEHLYVNAMPDNAADVAYLFTRDGEPLFRFLTGFAGGCGGDVWLDHERLGFGSYVLTVDGQVSDAPRNAGLALAPADLGLDVSPSPSGPGWHVVHYADEQLRLLDDGRHVFTTPMVGHGGCATGLTGQDVEAEIEFAPFE